MSTTDTTKTAAITGREISPQDAYLGFLFSFKSVGRGQMNYMLGVPEFRKRVGELVLSGSIITEQNLAEVLRGILDDVENGLLDRKDIPAPNMRNMLRRLERSIAAKVSNPTSSAD